jgi:hypothetical protein
MEKLRDLTSQELKEFERKIQEMNAGKLHSLAKRQMEMDDPVFDTFCREFHRRGIQVPA